MKTFPKNVLQDLYYGAEGLQGVAGVQGPKGARGSTDEENSSFYLFRILYVSVQKNLHLNWNDKIL